MNFEEFLKPQATENEPTTPVAEESAAPVAPTEEVPVEEVPAEIVEMVGGAEVQEEPPAEVALDVQKAVVESLAADKAEQDETIAQLRKDNYALQTEIAKLKHIIDEQNAALAKVGDTLAINSETQLSNRLTLIERESELPDRFPGESRDHVIEVIKEARDAAERDGRSRRAQILEAVLVANEPEGTLAKKRAELEKLFADNANLVSGPVIAKLEELGISHKQGEEYLLPKEILLRNY